MFIYIYLYAYIYVCVCVLPLTYFSAEHANILSRRGKYRNTLTPLSFFSFTLHSALLLFVSALLSSSLLFLSLCYVLSPSLSLFLITHSSQSCLCLQDDFFLSFFFPFFLFFIPFSFLLSLLLKPVSFSPIWINLLPELFFFHPSDTPVTCRRCPRAFADAASHSLLNGDGMIEIGMIDGRSSWEIGGLRRDERRNARELEGQRS